MSKYCEVMHDDNNSRETRRGPNVIQQFQSDDNLGQWKVFRDTNESYTVQSKSETPQYATTETCKKQ